MIAAAGGDRVAAFEAQAWQRRITALLILGAAALLALLPAAGVAANQPVVVPT